MPATLDHPLRRLWAEGKAALNGWLSIPNALSAEAMARQGWDTVTIDVQHGLSDYATATEMLTAIALTDAVPFVRLGSPDPFVVTRYLDAGALGLICPLIENADQARTFAASARYAPRGNRSWGPMRAQMLYGNHYGAKVNDSVVTFAMIETGSGLKNLDAILDVEGLDGVYIGPSDLSLALGMTPVPDREEPEFLKIIDDIGKRAAKKGLIGAMHCAGPAFARRAIDMGFKFITVVADVRLIVLGAQQAVGDLRRHQGR
jgi:4-hydroxy-2-oxoheptanedioate aldolase